MSGATRMARQSAEAVRLDLLKSTYRLDRRRNVSLYELVGELWPAHGDHSTFHVCTSSDGKKPCLRPSLAYYGEAQ